MAPTPTTTDDATTTDTDTETDTGTDTGSGSGDDIDFETAVSAAIDARGPLADHATKDQDGWRDDQHVYENTLALKACRTTALGFRRAISALRDLTDRDASYWAANDGLEDLKPDAVLPHVCGGLRHHRVTLDDSPAAAHRRDPYAYRFNTDFRATNSDGVILAGRVKVSFDEALPDEATPHVPHWDHVNEDTEVVRPSIHIHYRDLIPAEDRDYTPSPHTGTVNYNTRRTRTVKVLGSDDYDGDALPVEEFIEHVERALEEFRATAEPARSDRVERENARAEQLAAAAENDASDDRQAGLSQF